MEIPRDTLSRQNRDGEASDILFTLIIALSDNCGSQTRPREFNETTWKKKAANPPRAAVHFSGYSSSKKRRWRSMSH